MGFSERPFLLPVSCSLVLVPFYDVRYEIVIFSFLFPSSSGSFCIFPVLCSSSSVLLSLPSRHLFLHRLNLNLSEKNQQQQNIFFILSATFRFVLKVYLFIHSSVFESVSLVDVLFQKQKDASTGTRPRTSSNWFYKVKMDNLSTRPVSGIDSKWLSGRAIARKANRVPIRLRLFSPSF